jgi:hypothetical protein
VSIYCAPRLGIGAERLRRLCLRLGFSMPGRGARHHFSYAEALAILVADTAGEPYDRHLIDGARAAARHYRPAFLVLHADGYVVIGDGREAEDTVLRVLHETGGTARVICLRPLVLTLAGARGVLGEVAPRVPVHS